MKTVIQTIQFTDSKWKGVVCDKFIFCKNDEEVEKSRTMENFIGTAHTPSYKVLHTKVIEDFDPFKYVQDNPTPINLTP